MCDFPALQIDSLQLATNIDLNTKTAILRIPESFITGALNDCLNSSAGGRVKDTDFQKVDISFKGIDFISGGLAVVFNTRLQFRELLFRNPITGNRVFTDWVSISADGTAKFNVALANEVLSLDAQDVDIRLQGPLAELGDFLVDLFNAEDKIKGKIQNEINSFNGLSAIQLFKKFAPVNLIERLKSLGISDSDIQLILDRVSIDVSFSDIEMNLIGRW